MDKAPEESTSDSDLTKPERGAEDAAHTLTKAGISAIPVVGGPAAELFSAIITPPLSKRREKWIESIVDRLKELESKVDEFSIESLGENDMFLTTVLHASQAAIRNHQDEKLEALRNAVLNAALPNPPQEDLQLMFLDFVDRLTSWHLRLLKFLDDPGGWGDKHGISFPKWQMGAPATVLEHAFPELRERRDFYDQLVRDLYSRGLLNTESLHGNMTEQGMFASRTAAIGQQFLAFITSPETAD
jgi:hypothetical protein